MIKVEQVVLWLALVAGILGFSNSASADWQDTVWGMSVEEAHKAFRVPHVISIGYPSAAKNSTR